MSIFSPCSSLITLRTRWPMGPMQAPLALTPCRLDFTAIFVRWPASRAMAQISTVPSAISGTSSANSLRTRLGCDRDSVTCGPRMPLRTEITRRLDPLAVLVALAGHPLAQRQDRLELAEVDHHVVGVAALLDDPGDEVALLAEELPEPHVVLGVAQPLEHDLLGRGRGDPAEALGGVVVLPHLGAVVVELGGEHGDVPGLAVQDDAGVVLGARALVVRREQRLLDRLHEDVEGDLLLAFEHPQDAQVDVHQEVSLLRRLNSTWTSALATSA